MNDSLREVNLIRDNATVAALSAELSALGGIMICYSCDDVEALIVGLLVIEQEEEAWPLCGECLRRLPLAGALV
jgi:hypothetical protein